MFQRSLSLAILATALLSACQSAPAFNAAQFPAMQRQSLQRLAAPRSQAVDSGRYIAEVASAFHEAWRAGRRKPDGSFEPRLKETKDPAWIQAHGRNQVDIANTAYRDLPADWQAENKASAEISVQLILAAKGALLTPAFIEQGSHVIHVKWLERNAWAKGGELDVPYAQLPEPEKQKDREALYQAIHKGLELKVFAQAQVSPAVAQAVAQMLAKIQR